MTEAEWLAREAEWQASDDLGWMLGYIAKRASGRKFRLYTCASGRLIWYSLVEEFRTLIAAAELFADGQCTAQRLSALKGSCTKAMNKGRVQSDVLENLWCMEVANTNAVGGAWRYAYFTNSGTPNARQSAIVRCIFGNPFRVPLANPRHLSPAVVSLAGVAYDERDLPSGHLDPDRLAILADALEDAGSTDASILDHLRSPGPHVRGCWALDLVLGRE
jgi:hypothetical protein